MDKVLKDKKIIIGISGSIAAVKAPLLVSRLVKQEANVQCVITPSASNLVSPISLATLSRKICHQDIDQWDPKQPRPLHIALAEWADLIVVTPMSATTLGKWANGIADGLLSSLLLAFEGPVIAAAAMNTGMWKNSAVQKNWVNLQKDSKVLALAPSKGLLACDRLGEGKMVEPELIELAIQSSFYQKQKNGELKKDLINQRLISTAGPTEEYLDPARLLTNKSSGKMGVLIAQAAKLRGAHVDLIHGSIHTPSAWLEGLQTHEIKTAEDMRNTLKKLQPTSTAIAMAAAISDIRKINGCSKEKLNKQIFLESFQDSLEEVPDLLEEICRERTSKQVILGFAALTGNKEEILEKGHVKIRKKGCHLLMANPIDLPHQGFGANYNGGYLIGPKDRVREIPVMSKLALAHQLLDAILEISQNNS